MRNLAFSVLAVALALALGALVLWVSGYDVSDALGTYLEPLYRVLR